MKGTRAKLRTKGFMGEEEAIVGDRVVRDSVVDREVGAGGVVQITQTEWKTKLKKDNNDYN